MSLVEFRNVSKTFTVGKRQVQALLPMSLTIERGECHAIVGESGSGKSTLANLLLGVHAPSSGEILFDGKRLESPRPKDIRRRIQFVQQNPFSALNPRHSISQSIGLGMSVHLGLSAAEQKTRLAAIIEAVGLDASLADRFPSALSGGQRQRVAIARALAVEPELLVLDEPTSALDVLVQARILALLAKLRAEREITYVFISHDLAVVRNLADRVSVFEKGRLVETGPVAQIFENPQQDYTRRLISSTPVISDDEARLRARLTDGLPQNAINE